VLPLQCTATALKEPAFGPTNRETAAAAARKSRTVVVPQDLIGADSLAVLNDGQAAAPTWPPAREQNPQQAIGGAEPRTAGPAAAQHRDLVAQRNDFQGQLVAPAKSGARPGDFSVQPACSHSNYPVPAKCGKDPMRIKI
jgi:hypothetical protein